MSIKLKPLLAFVLSWIFIYLLYISSAPNLFKVSLAIISLFLAGKIVEKELKPSKELVFYLWKSRKGISLMANYTRKLSPYIRLMLDIYLFVAFGVIALFVMRWRSVKERLLLMLPGYILLFATYLIYPYIMSVLAVMLGIRGTAHASSPLIFFLFGISPSITLALFYSSLNIIYLFAEKYIFDKNVVIHQAATLLLPGINIPFLEGIIALVLILAIHEVSHGIAAIMEKIRVVSLGIITFGTLPLGAFVEPNEKQLLKAEPKVKARVAIAGVGSNVVASLLGGIFLMLFLIAFPSSTCFSVDEGKLLPLSSCGDGTLTLSNSFLRNYPNPFLSLLYNTLVLFTALNLIVAVVNLLPFPFFDGNMLFHALFPRWIAKVSEYIALFSLAVSILPSLVG